MLAFQTGTMETKIRSCESEASPKGRATQTELWKRLQDFDLDGDAAFPFTRRLTRDNAWSPQFAMRVAEEYKKFLFLAVESGHPVTPSDEVDQAWHLHLCYTRSYWDELCAQVLERPLHHGPTRGGAQESAKFNDWYARTLDSYREHFDCEPPSDIWPAAEVRFAQPGQWRRVSTQSHWVLKKPRLLNFLPALSTLGRARESVPFAPPLAGASALLILCVALFIGGDAQGAVARNLSGLNIFNWSGPSFLALFWSLCLIGAIAILTVRGIFTLPDDRSFPTPELDAYQAARLSDAGDLPTDAALASLQRARKIHIGRNGRISRWDDAPPSHLWEREVWNAIAGGHQTLSGVRQSVRDKLKYLDLGLEQAGLLIEPSLVARVQRICLSIPLALLLIGLSKIAIGVSRGKPVGFLLATCVALGAVMLCLWSSRPRRSKRGNSYLEHLRWRHKRADLRARAATDEGAIAFSLALWGYSELDALGMAEARAAMRPVSSGGDSGGSSGGSDGGSSCGGSGDGGGGGGCGGGGCGGCGGG